MSWGYVATDPAVDQGKKETKLSAGHVQEINTRLLAFRPSIPKCFAWKPRGFDETDRWKATEFRQFLLYTGKVVLKGILTEDLFTPSFHGTVSVHVYPHLSKASPPS